MILRSSLKEIAKLQGTPELWLLHHPLRFVEVIGDLRGLQWFWIGSLAACMKDLYKPLWRLLGPRELLALHNFYQSGVVNLLPTPTPPHPIFITRHKPKKEFRKRVLVSPVSHSCKNAIISKTNPIQSLWLTHSCIPHSLIQWPVLLQSLTHLPT